MQSSPPSSCFQQFRALNPMLYIHQKSPDSTKGLNYLKALNLTYRVTAFVIALFDLSTSWSLPLIILYVLCFTFTNPNFM